MIINYLVNVFPTQNIYPKFASNWKDTNFGMSAKVNMLISFDCINIIT